MNCKVPSCPEPHRAKGYCSLHYQQNLGHNPRDTNRMRDFQWALILSMEQIPDMTIDSLVGSSGLWRKHCARFKKNLGKRIAKIRKMNLPQQCAYYRGIAYVRAGQ